MIEIIKASFKNKNLISLCIGKVDWDKRIIGYVKSIGNHNVVIDVIDIWGSVVKSKNIAIDKITVLEVNDSYIKHLEVLKKQGNVIKKAKPVFYHNGGDSFGDNLEELRIKKAVCTIFYGTEYLTCIIKRLRDGILFVNPIGYKGTKEGKACCKLDSITKIRCKGPLEEKITYLLKKD